VKNHNSNLFFKVASIFYLISSFFIFSYNYINQVNFQGYPNRFISFIEMVKHGYIDPSYIPIIPLFDSHISIDTSLSTFAQGVLKTNSLFPGLVSLYMIITDVLGLSPQSLMISSIGAILIPFAYYLLVKANFVNLNFRNDSQDFYFGLILIYGMIAFMVTKGYMAFYAGAIGNILLLLCLYCIIKYFNETNNKYVYFFMLTIITFSLSHYWHTALLNIMLFIISVFVVSNVVNIINIKSYGSAYKKSAIRIDILTFLIIVIALTFNHVWQTNYPNYFVSEVNIFDFFSKLFIKLKGEVPFSFSYIFNYKDLFWGKIYFFSMLAIHFIGSVMLTYALYNLLRYKPKLENKAINQGLILGISLILAQIVSIIVYYPTKSLSFFYVPLFFPLFAVYIYGLTKNVGFINYFMKISLVLIISLGLVCNISLLITNHAGETSITKYEDVGNSFGWILKYVKYNNLIICDYNILHKYLQYEAKVFKPKINFNYLVPEVYKSMVEGRSLKSSDISYVVIDYKSMLKGIPIYSEGSRGKLLIPMLDKIDNSLAQNKIYQDNCLSIYNLNLAQ